MSLKTEQIVYKNFGKCLSVVNNGVKLMTTLDFGPRIIYFGLENEENLLLEDVDRNFFMDVEGYGRWYTYGGHRVWRSPEVFPETYVPDNEPVEWSLDNNVLSVSQKETSFGKQFSLICTFNDDGSVKVENRIRNCSDKPQKFAPWAITGLCQGGTEYIKLNTADTGFLANRTMALWPYADIKDVRFTLTNDEVILRQDPDIKKRFKAGFNITSGEVRYVSGKQYFLKKFENYNENYNYPDFGCNFETYTNEHFIECELIGDERDYMPGETASIIELWFAGRTED